MTMLLAALIAAGCGILVGMRYKVYMLVPCLIALACAGMAHFIAHGSWWSFAIIAAAILSLEGGYVIGMIIEDRTRRSGSSGPQRPLACLIV